MNGRSVARICCVGVTPDVKHGFCLDDASRKQPAKKKKQNKNTAENHWQGFSSPMVRSVGPTPPERWRCPPIELRINLEHFTCSQLQSPCLQHWDHLPNPNKKSTIPLATDFWGIRDLEHPAFCTNQKMNGHSLSASGISSSRQLHPNPPRDRTGTSSHLSRVALKCADPRAAVAQLYK